MTRAVLHRLVPLLLCILAALLPVRAQAHESLPIVISLWEAAPGRFVVTTRLPGNIDPAQRPRLSLAAPCRVSGAEGPTQVFACPRRDRPAAIAAAWPGGVPASALLLRSEFADGTQSARVMPAGSTALALPRQETALGVATSYVRIGAEHILFGIDHLLFLVLLVLITRTPRRTALTVTGFTLGHALTITLASLGAVHVDGRVVEALIALSIVFVATELARGGRDTLFTRYPVIVAAGFGLLHGLGFAGALAEIGLAQSQVALSLIGFNIGVELGQMLFVAAVLAAIALARRIPAKRGTDDAAPNRWLAHTRSAAVTGIGVVAAFWFWERGLLVLA